MNKLFKKAAAFFLAAAILILQCSVTAFADDPLTPNPIITSYTLTNSSGTALKSIKSGSKFNMSISIRDVAIKTSDIAGDSDIDFIKTIDSFTYGSYAAKISSETDKPLSLTIELKDCVWAGGSTDFTFMLGYLSLGSGYTNLTLTIKECYENTNLPSAPSDDVTAEPVFKIGSKKTDIPVKAGQEGTFELVLKNMGPVAAERVLVEVSPSEDTVLTKGSESQDISVVLPGDSKSLDITYKALDKVNSAKQVFNVTIKYYYESGANEVIGTTTGSVSVASNISTTERVYPVVLSEFSLSEKELQPNTEYDGFVTIKNIGTADMKGVFVSFASGDSFILTGGTSSAYISAIAVGQKVDIPVKIKTLSEISSLKQDLAMSLKYTYIMGSDELDGSNDAVFTMFAPISDGTSPRPVISLNSVDTAIESGKKYRIYINVENKGDVAMDNVKLNVKGSDGIIILNSTDTSYIERVGAGKKKSAMLEFQTAGELSTPTLFLNVDLTYSYTVAGKVTQGQESSALSLDAKVSGTPYIRVSGESSRQLLKEDTEYEHTVTINNLGTVAVKNMYLDFTASDSLYFLDGTEYAFVPVIKAGESAQVVVRFKTTENIASFKQEIGVAYKYNYGRDTALLSGEGTSHITLIADSDSLSPSGDGSIAAPNIIIGSYDIGAEQIAAGDTFNLSLDFYNTSGKVPVENMVMTINAGGDINIFGGGNTYFYPSLDAAAAIHEDISLRALATAVTGTSTVTISFKYDYLDGKQRNTATAEQTLFIPVYQPDKITFDVAVPTYSVTTGQEVYITTTYLNKGRCDISNVKAEIVGDVSALSTTKVIGNVAPGATGTFDFIITPFMAGECSFTILITYEDATLTEKTKEIPVSFLVEEMMWEEPFPGEFPMTMEGEGEGKSFPWLILWIGVGVVVVAAVVVIICVVRHKKKKAKKLTADDIDWEDDIDEVLYESDKHKV